MKSNLYNKKSECRKKQFVIRKKLFSNTYNVFNNLLFEDLFDKINIKKINIVSSFFSINTEINTDELNNFIISKNKILCFPVIIKKNEHLIFREFTFKDELKEGMMKIKEPSSKNKILIPELLFIPCLAFDNRGYRLGYGGGYYDRTLDNLKNTKKKIISVGYAFDGQKVSAVPKDKFDIKLDYVITEKKIYKFE